MKNLQIAAFATAQNLNQRAKERLSAEDGAVSTEYMIGLAIIAVIVVYIFKNQIGRGLENLGITVFNSMDEANTVSGGSNATPSP